MDEILRAISGDGFVSVAAISARELTERAMEIHGASRTAAAAMGRVVSGTLLLGQSLKHGDASVTVRVNGGGAVGTILAVADAHGGVRCCAGNPGADLPLRGDGKLDVGGLVGKNGMLTVIRDFGEGEPYSGSVELVSGEIAEDFTKYLSVSDQLPSAVALGVLISGDGRVRAAGGYIASLLPGAPEDVVAALERNVATAGPVTRVLDEAGADGLVARVLAGMDARVLARADAEYRCHCSREKVRDAISGIGDAEIADILAKNETVEVTCRFCDAVYHFPPEEFAKKKKNH
ncbi:MAG: Hsp33 family molecular chaperone HslO [Oscillospiraceae bacterium]|nr:Hsp33 family molecular chaperone HslO [Oscillospiraceae bacterium]